MKNNKKTSVSQVKNENGLFSCKGKAPVDFNKSSHREEASPFQKENSKSLFPSTEGVTCQTAHDSRPRHGKEAFSFGDHASGSKAVSLGKWRLADHRLAMRILAGESWADWLKDDRWGWQYFVTLTFKQDVHPEQANRCFRRWVRRINEKTFGKRYRRSGQGITWVRGLEFQRRGVIHFHALFSGLPELWSRFGAMSLWENLVDNSGFARIFPYRVAASNYISKYVSKGGDLDFWIGGKSEIVDLFIN